MTYDAHNRLVQQVSTLAGTPSETITWTYDDGELKGESAPVRALGSPIFVPPSLTPFRGWRGRLVSMSDPSGRTTWTYERRGLVTREERILGTSVYQTTYAYDANGNRTSITYPSGRQVDTTFDYADRPLSVTSGATPIVTSATYLPFGPLQQLTLGNGTTQTMAFDGRYQVAGNSLTGPSGTIANYAYGHDGAGNVTRIHDLTDPSYDRDFGYDDLQRLVTADSGAALWGHGTYSYDAMGNMLSLSLGTSRSASFNYQGTTPLLSSVTENGLTRGVTYDAAGNELTVGSNSFVYSARNKLRAAGGFTYLYDGRGLRTTTTGATPPPPVTNHD